MFFYGATLDWKSVIRDASGEDEPLGRSILYVIVDGEVDLEAKHSE